MPDQAAKVEYKASDYKTAAQIRRASKPPQPRPMRRLAACPKVGDYMSGAETAVYFPNGSARSRPRAEGSGDASPSRLKDLRLYDFRTGDASPQEMRRSTSDQRSARAKVSII